MFAPVLAVIGVAALYAMFIWLASAVVAGYLAARKGYPERYGLATSLLLPIIGIIIWLIVPAREGSDWKVIGPFGRDRPETKELLEAEKGADA